jgi:hypothetical protein
MDLDDFAVAGHVAECAYCTARRAAAERLAVALRQPVAAPKALEGRAGLEGVYERIHAAAEGGPLGQLLAAAMPVVTPPTVVATAADDRPGPALLAAAAVQPPLPSSGQWAAVGARLRAERKESRLHGRRLRVAGVALASTAAAAIMAAFLISDGTRDEPAIVFVDTVAQPSATLPAADFSPFSVVRRGR